MQKEFNTTGPCLPNEHYMLPAQSRCPSAMRLIERKKYFVIHAARQTGKTTMLLDMANQINSSGDYYGLYCTLEALQDIHDAKEGIPIVIQQLQYCIEFNPVLSQFPFASDLDSSQYGNLVNRSLARFCQLLDKPLVILFDEVDCLSNQTLISFLRQLRTGYVNRGTIPFMHSVALVGMRNVRDFKAKIREEQDTLGSASPFNIIAEALTIRNFTHQEVADLCDQHTQETGQVFPADVIESVFENTQGQPWLVNAIAHQIVEKTQTNELSTPIALDHVDRAIQALIKRRDTHIDSLLERLKETRVQKIVEPLILGEQREYDSLHDDYRYVLDLGLLAERNKKLVPANPIYTEVILWVLTHQAQTKLDDADFPPEAPAYLVDGRLDMKHLLNDFQEFWRENSEIWIERYWYKEAAPHLILQAFLQRVINSGGAIIREMASGTQRLDLCVIFDNQRYPLELKLRYSDKTYNEGKHQLVGYMDRLGCEEGWLIVFDRRPEIDWKQKLFWQTESIRSHLIHIVGC